MNLDIFKCCQNNFLIPIYNFVSESYITYMNINLEYFIIDNNWFL
jgi:hypothetical protein